MNENRKEEEVKGRTHHSQLLCFQLTVPTGGTTQHSLQAHVC